MGLKGGKVDATEKAITCPWHDSQFCLKTGEAKRWVNGWHKEISIILYTKKNTIKCSYI